MEDNSALFQKSGQVKPKSDEMREKGSRGGRAGRGKRIHPLKIEMRELARAYGPEVLEGLLRIFRDESIDVDMRMVAGNIILDRGFGKPVMAAPETGNGQVVVNVIGSDGKPILQAHDSARFISDCNSALAEGSRRGPLEEHTAKLIIKPTTPRPHPRAPVVEPVQHRLFATPITEGK